MAGNVAYRGHQAFWSGLRMKARVYLNTFAILFAAQLVLATVLTTAKNYDGIVDAGKTYLAAFGDKRAAAKAREFKDFSAALEAEWKSSFAWMTLVYLALPFLIRFYHGAGQEDKKKRIVRGASRTTAEAINKEISRGGEKTHIKIGELNYPVSAEPKYSLIIGRSDGKNIRFIPSKI